MAQPMSSTAGMAEFGGNKTNVLLSKLWNFYDLLTGFFPSAKTAIWQKGAVSVMKATGEETFPART